ncbi:unnamed protein product [Bemisia tabaci]|uniref:Coatomer subunit delta n=1 Tax=Bemisia tabaci TaxID=7038 RepID=A0A9P0C8G2_BEMTA|nr:unnamed protein product [Bemisia tabaci]
MVLIAAAVCTKAGKTIVSRQFVEMTKARIEGLLAAFPKLMSSGKQHTFIETESVRYVYQPLEKLYMLLITTKASNILEDLETLRLFSRVIPEYCRHMEEAEIAENAFNLIFAFDEIVALGYRESVNLAQIRTFVEMDSHEEKVYQAVRQTQEREAKNKMREKTKEIQKRRLEYSKGNLKFGSAPMDFRNHDYSSPYTPLPVSDEKKPSLSPASKPSISVKAMKLGGKNRDVESFVDQLKSEGENVVSPPVNDPVLTANSKVPPSILANIDDVHLRQEEKLIVSVGRDGGVQNFELHGLVSLRISNDKYGKIRVQINNNDDRGFQFQTHPNVDKELFKTRGQIGLKNPTKPFPLNTDVGVLKWRFQTRDEAAIPLSINCWPSENGQGGCDVNIEYELEHPDMELNDVSITIPIPMGCTPIIAACDGEYAMEPRKNVMIWNLPPVDSSNKNGALEFSTSNARPADFFPVAVSFHYDGSYARLKTSAVVLVEDETPVKFSNEAVLYTEKYEIL